MANLLIVDDDVKFLDVVSKLLVGRGYEVFVVDNGETALLRLAERRPDLLICDLNMKPITGIEVLKAVQSIHPGLAVIIMTAYGTVDSAMESLRMGAYDYMTKPFRVQEFVETIERALAWDASKNTDDEEPAIPYRLGELVAESASMKDACTMIERVAPTDVTVLFHGEHGVGKQLAGRTIHARSPRRDGPFIVADCANPPPVGLAVHLFGTSALDAEGRPMVPGVCRQASGGTLWLSEIGLLSLAIQERLLRVFKEQLIIPEGAQEQIPVNVRVLAETAMNIERAVAQGRFRGDLFARFAPIAVEIKPLRERREDIIPLLWHFLRSMLGADIALPRIDPDARGLLRHYAWPGNGHELMEVARHIVKAGAPQRITSKHLPDSIIRSLSGLPATTFSTDESGRARALKAFLSREAKLAAATGRHLTTRPGTK